jgi:hypothetical protein
LLFYICVLAVPLLWWGRVVLPPSRLREPVAAGLIWAVLVIFIGLRREVGGDWTDYVSLLSRAETNSFAVSLALSDPGFMAINELAASLGWGIAVVNLVCAILFTMGLVMLSLRQASPGWALLISLPVLILVVSLGFTRQSAALGLAMIAVAAFQGDRAKHGLVALALAPLFHWSALIMWPLAGFVFRKRPISWRLGAATVCGAALVVVAVTLFLPLEWVLSIYRAPPAAGTLFRMAPTFVALIAYLWLRRTAELDAPFRTLSGYLAALGVVLLPLALASPTVADRLGFYMVLLQMMVLPRALLALPRGTLRTLGAAALGGMYIVLMMGWLLKTPYRTCWSPYRTYLSTPDLLFSGAPYRHARSSRQCEDTRAQQTPTRQSSNKRP